MSDKKTYTYYSTGKKGEPDPFEIFEQFFGKPKPTNQTPWQKIQAFIKDHSGILIILGLLAMTFIGFYVMSVLSWREGKCIILVPWFSHSTTETCAGLIDALSNTLYLFITAIVIGVFMTLYNVYNRRKH